MKTENEECLQDYCRDNLKEQIKFGTHLENEKMKNLSLEKYKIISFNI